MVFKDRAPSNKTLTLSKSMNTDIWVLGTSNKLFTRGFKLKQSFLKNKVITDKTPFFVKGPFCTPQSICLNIGLRQSSFVWKCCVLNLSTFNQTTVLQLFEKGLRFSENLLQS